MFKLYKEHAVFTCSSYDILYLGGRTSFQGEPPFRRTFYGGSTVDRVGRDLGLFKNEHEQIELRNVPALEDFPLVTISNQMQAGCGTDVLVRVYLRIRVCRVNGDVVIDDMLEGATRVEALKLRIAEIENIPPHQQHYLVGALR